MNNQDSFDRIVSYFHALCSEPFTYKGKEYVPYARLIISPLVFRSYVCPPHCGACCMKCSLVWDKKPSIMNKKKKITINDQTVLFYEDQQEDNQGGKCRYLNFKNARCGIYEQRPLPCRFELFKFIHFQSGAKVYARVQLPGRKWALTRIDGGKGALCSIKFYDKKMTQAHITDLKIISDWMDRFTIKHETQKIIEYLSTGPKQKPLILKRGR